MSSAAANSRVRFPLETKPVSVRAPWHRLSILGALALLMAFPWVTTTGCEGKSDPVVWYGAELLVSTAHHNASLLFGPLLLLACALVLVAVARSSAGPKRRFFVHLGSALLGLAGVFLTFLALAMPTAGDVENHHAAWAVGIALLLGFVVDSLFRVGAGAREWWRYARPKKAAPTLERVAEREHRG